MTPISVRIRCALLMAVCLLGAPPAFADRPPIVAAASDLQFALPEVAAEFTRETGKQVRLTFGSSGNLRRQIAHGAPFELFLSADEEYVLALHRDGHVADEGILYAIGRIVLMVPRGSTLTADGELQDLRAALTDGRLQRFAIANPQHAPYGVRAREALGHAGLWDAISPLLVYGENVSQAAQFATSGAAQGGIIAWSLALAPEVSKLGEFALISAERHAPLRQRMVLVRGAGETARAFYRFLQQTSSREILARYGFVLPGEPGPASE
jgi:molybdate transport system substrate-binding protein